MPLSLVAKGLIGAFAVSGALHLVKPQVFEPTMPRALPKHRELIYVSGVAELACAAGLAIPATRKLAGPASAALLVAVLPANVQMAADAVERLNRKGLTPKRVGWALAYAARVPLQLPLIRAALRAAR